MICWKTDNSGLCYLDLPNCQGDGGVVQCRVFQNTAFYTDGNCLFG